MFSQPILAISQAELTVGDVKMLIAQLESEGHSDRRITPIIEVLGAALGVAVKWKFIKSNPVNELDALLLGNAPR